jgi:hypothetical protein
VAWRVSGRGTVTSRHFGNADSIGGVESENEQEFEMDEVPVHSPETATNFRLLHAILKAAQPASSLRFFGVERDAD